MHLQSTRSQNTLSKRILYILVCFSKVMCRAGWNTILQTYPYMYTAAA